MTERPTAWQVFLAECAVAVEFLFVLACIALVLYIVLTLGGA